MTELLSQLLHDEADRVDVPAPDTALLLARGRGVRRRRRAGAVGLAAAAVVVVGSTVALSGMGASRDSSPDPAAPDRGRPVFAVGSTVYLEGRQVELPESVHSLHYTSVGVVVRTNDPEGTSDGSGDERLTLVRPDGSTVALGETPEGQGPVTDPAQPWYAVAEQADGTAVAVVHDARTGEVVARNALPRPELGSSPWLSLEGDVLFAQLGDRSVALDWRTGEPLPLAAAAARGLVRDAVVGGVGEDPDSRVALDPFTGDVLLSVPMPRGSFGFLDPSPDGRSAIRFVEPGADTGEVRSTRVYDVATGAYVTVPAPPADLGWTADGDVFTVDLTVGGGRVRTCSPLTGDCTETTVQVPQPAGPVVLGGRDLEG